jgi:type I restriction enzyme M protein
LRRQLIEARAVDVMVSVGPNMFYTVTLPCTLWFLDRGKQGKRRDKVLFLDARNVYRQIDRAHRDWTEAQMGFIANVVRLYRGEEIDLTFGGDEAECEAPRGVRQEAEVRGRRGALQGGDVERRSKRRVEP